MRVCSEGWVEKVLGFQQNTLGVPAVVSWGGEAINTAKHIRQRLTAVVASAPLV